MQKAHPAISFIHFLLAIVGAMLFTHPAACAITLLAALSYGICLKGIGVILRRVVVLLPFLMFATIINGLLNGSGSTPILYFGSYVITSEALIYALCSAAIIAAVMLWFTCFNVVISSDKLIHLFGKRMPRLSLLFTMTLRFVPHFGQQAKAIATAQKGIGRLSRADTRQDGRGLGNYLKALKRGAYDGAVVFSTLLSWSLENAMETADSMRARGYGLPGRSAYSPYRFGQWDFVFGIMMLICTAIVAFGSFQGSFSMAFFPLISGIKFNSVAVFAYGAYAAILFMPSLIWLLEEICWHFTKSKI